MKEIAKELNSLALVIFLLAMVLQQCGQLFDWEQGGALSIEVCRAGLVILATGLWLQWRAKDRSNVSYAKCENWFLVLARRAGRQVRRLISSRS